VEAGLLGERSKRVVAIALSIALQCYASTSPHSIGPLRPVLEVEGGTVEVNGVVISKPLDLNPGDSVRVLVNSTATIREGSVSEEKTLITLNGNTSLEWKDEGALTLHDGNIVVNSRDFTTYLDSCGHVTPFHQQPADNANTKYEVQIQGDRAFVYARELSATVENDGKKLDVKPMRVAAVESIRATKCKIAYVDAPDNFMLNNGVLAAYFAAGVVLLYYPDPKASISADCPIDPCKSQP
jgi:hypothetical protein